MNRAEIMAKWDAMTPRERDAWIHEKIFGYKSLPFVDPPYSTDRDSAWKITEKFKFWSLFKCGDDEWIF